MADFLVRFMTALALMVIVDLSLSVSLLADMDPIARIGISFMINMGIAFIVYAIMGENRQYY